MPKLHPWDDTQLEIQVLLNEIEIRGYDIALFVEIPITNLDEKWAQEENESDFVGLTITSR